MSELKKRVITSLIGVSVLLGVLIYGDQWGVLAFALFLNVALLWEYSNLVFQLPDRESKKIFLILIGIGLFFCAWNIHNALLLVLIFAFLINFLFYLFLLKGHEEHEHPQHIRELMFSFFGLFYLGLLPLLFVYLHEHFGLKWLLLFLFLNWATDIGAYFAGKWWGRRKIYPQVSPKKTVEGCVGGLVFALLIGHLYCAWLSIELTFVQVSVVVLAVSLVAQVGDFCESLIKRLSGRKESGSLLPGHGGFFDRFDGVVFSLPIMYLLGMVFKGVS